MFSSLVYIFPAALETNILPLSICGSQFIPFFASPVIKAKTVAGGTIPQTCRRALCSTQNRNIHPLWINTADDKVCNTELNLGLFPYHPSPFTQLPLFRNIRTSTCTSAQISVLSLNPMPKESFAEQIIWPKSYQNSGLLMLCWHYDGILWYLFILGYAEKHSGRIRRILPGHRNFYDSVLYPSSLVTIRRQSFKVARTFLIFATSVVNF